MNNLILTKKGNIAKRNSTRTGAFAPWTSIIDELIGQEDLFRPENKTLPKVNIHETDETYILEFSVPGYKKFDFIVDIENEELSISADLKEAKESEKKYYTRREFDYSSFKRKFTLPETVEEQGIEAGYENGILKVMVPKKEEAKPKPARTIEIA